MPVFVDDGVGVRRAFLGGYRDDVAAVAACSIGPTRRDKLAWADDDDPDVRDLVTMRRRPKQRCVPLGIDALDPKIEQDRPPLIVVRDHLGRGGLSRTDERRDYSENNEQAAHRA